MAFIDFDSDYAPIGFLIVKTGGDSSKEADTILVQSDWDYPGIASSMGWVPCKKCRQTDGTVDCSHRTVSEMITEAYDYIEERDGKEFEALDEYFATENPRKGKYTNAEREDWVNNVEGLYLMKKRSRRSMRVFVRENKDIIDDVIDEVLGR